MACSDIRDNKLAAVCGLYCGSCSAYIATQESEDNLKKIADQFGMTVEMVRCKGCRSDKRGGYCEQCKMFECAWNKGYDFCHQCPDYPCAELKLFQQAAPHRNDLWKDNQAIKEIGCNCWLKEVEKRYTCSSCGTVNSAYDLTCRNCGNDPSCEFIIKNKNEIISALEMLAERSKT